MAKVVAEWDEEKGAWVPINPWVFYPGERVPVDNPSVNWTQLEVIPAGMPRVEYVKHRTLYTIKINGVEVEAEERVWQELKRSLIDQFGVYSPPEGG